MEPGLLLYSYLFVLYYLIFQGFLTVGRDVLLVGLGDEEFKGQILHLCSVILLSGESHLDRVRASNP